MKFRVGDSVVVVTGKDKNKTGSILRVLPTKNRVVVAGINMRTKHVKATPQRPGQRLQYEASIDASNVMIVDPKTKKRSRIGQATDKKGKKQRIAKRSGEVITATAPVITEEVKDKRAAAKKGQEELAAKRAGKTTAKKKEEKPEGEKKPFWKKVGFGEQAMEDAAEVASEKQMQKDHSVPDQGKTPDALNHERGK